MFKHAMAVQSMLTYTLCLSGAVAEDTVEDAVDGCHSSSPLATDRQTCVTRWQALHWCCWSTADRSFQVFSVHAGHSEGDLHVCGHTQAPHMSRAAF
jgi:hypothetical protein